MVTASQVKAYLKEKGMRTSKELLDALSGEVKGLLDQATMKALLDKRKTVKPEDLTAGE